MNAQKLFLEKIRKIWSVYFFKKYKNCKKLFKLEALMFTPEYNKFFQLGARNFHFSKYKRVFQNSKSSLLNLFILRARKIYFLKYKKHFFLRKCQKFFLEFPFFFFIFLFFRHGFKSEPVDAKVYYVLQIYYCCCSYWTYI